MIDFSILINAENVGNSNTLVVKECKIEDKFTQNLKCKRSKN